MKHLWNISLDDYLAIVKIAKANGKKPGDSMEEELLEYAQDHNLKSFGATELSTAELAKEYASHGKKILKIDTNDQGKQNYQIIK